MTRTSIGCTAAKMQTAGLLLISAFAASSLASGYREEDGSADYFRGHEPSGGGGGGGGNRQLPVILMHKQALQQDGGFQYAFAADNGLRQGESIRPDGSRTGAYSYTDPDGKEISVKYTAGKDGFRIIQGDHVPKAPVSVVPLQQPGLGGDGSPYSSPPSIGRSGPGKNRLFGAPGGPGSQFSRGDSSGGRYDSGEAYKSKYPKPQHYRVREEDDGGELAARYDEDAFDGTGDYSSHSPFRAPSSRLPAAFGGSPAKDDGPPFDSKEQHQQPHSFGSGYAFEFAGTDNGGTAAEF